jgi:hypothetical protein
MPTEAPAPSQRPRPWLLAMLGTLIVVAVVYWQWPAASPAALPSNQAAPRPAQQQPANARGSLDVRLEALKQPAPEPNEADRNPFRFQPKPPPAPPPSAVVPLPQAVVPAQPVGPPPAPPGLPPPPPIPLKFIGTLEGKGPGKVAIFSDGQGMPQYGHEGELVLGQYRVVKIGVESVVMEYADGRGRQTIPLRGQ